MAILRRNLISLYKTHFSSSLHPFSSAAAAKRNPVTVAEYLQQRHKFSPDAVSKLASSGKYLKDSEHCDSVISFFKKIGFTTTHLQHMIKRHPGVISSNVDLILKPKIKVLQDAGLTRTQIAEIISGCPRILWIGADRMSSTVSELKGVLKSRLGLFKVLKKGVSSYFLGRDLTLTVTPNLEFLLSCGIKSSQIVHLVHHYPRLLSLPHDSLKKCVERVEEMGCERTSNMFLHAIRTISSLSVENWERKLEIFRSLGFSEDDIRTAFRRYPQVFSISESKIKESAETLLNARNDAISIIVKNPGLLIYSVEKTLKPRLRVLEVLEKKNLLKRKPSLVTFCAISNVAFLERFVHPYYAEVGTIYNNPVGDLVET